MENPMAMMSNLAFRKRVAVQYSSVVNDLCCV